MPQDQLMVNSIITNKVLVSVLLFEALYGIMNCYLTIFGNYPKIAKKVFKEHIGS